MPRLLAGLAAAALALAGAAPAQGASSVAVYPVPGTSYNLPATQITFRGVAPDQIGQVQVVGSTSGAHSGHMATDSDGQGASFIPDQAFRPGEKVTVTTSLKLVGASRGTFSFTIAHPGKIGPAPLPLVAPGAHGLQHFHSRPDLLPPTVVVDKDSAPASEGDIFVAPQYGPVQDGPMILDPHGRLIWFNSVPVSKETLVTDFRVQAFRGKRVLTWWQGYTNRGSGRGVGMILDRSYKRVAVVHAGNGLAMDLHEFLLTPRATAWIIAASPVYIKGISKPVMDDVVQEIDVATGLVLFEWHALDHVPLNHSYFSPQSHSYIFDPYHMNSVSPLGSDSVLVSMRNTSAVYKVNLLNGKIAWELGGKHSSFRLAKGVSTAFQHDAIAHGDGTITIFDDGAGPPSVHPYARGIRVALDTGHMTAHLVREYDHSPTFSTNFEGNLQELTDGNVFMGWGQQPYFSEDDGHGRQVFDARFLVPSSSYRAYRFTWSGQPATPPALSAGDGPYGTTRVFASWNGATTVAAWRVLTGASASALTPIGRTRSAGFETPIDVHSQLPYFQVQALGAHGTVLSTSPAVQSRPHLAVFGRSVFVSGAGTGAVAAGCISPKPCRIATTISVGSTVISRTGREALDAGRGGLLFFRLSGSGLSMLRHARGHRLSVGISVRDASGLTGSSQVQLVPFSTTGTGPARNLSPSASLQIVGATAFASPSGVGGILVACYATSSCRVSGSLSTAAKTLATIRGELVGPGELGYVMFSLSAAGRALLAHAPGNQLATHVSLSNGSDTATGDIALARFS